MDCGLLLKVFFGEEEAKELERMFQGTDES